MFHWVTGLLALIVCARVVWPLHLPLVVRLLLCLLVIVFTQYHQVIRRWFGSMAAPDVPGPLLMVLGAGLGAALLAAMLALLLDAAGLIVWSFSRPWSKMLLTHHGLRAGLGALCVLLGIVAVWQAVKVPAVKRIELVLKRLPPELDGFRLVQITDLHASRLLERPWIQAVVDRTNALKPDAIVITGDFVDGSVLSRADDLAPLQQLHAPGGVYGVPGNHEYYSGYSPWMRELQQMGVQMLVNRHVVIAKEAGAHFQKHEGAVSAEGHESVQGGAGMSMRARAYGPALVIAGVPDTTAYQSGPVPPSAGLALQGAPAGAPVVMLSHRPQLALDHAAMGNIDLQLSGHTHGGQVLGMHWVVQRFNEGFVSGLYQVQDMQLYVSNGTGLWAGFPLRLGRPSEITEFTLRAAKR